MTEKSKIKRPARAIYGSPNNPLKIGNIEIPCYVLDNGNRVLSGRGMQNALALGQRHGALLRAFLAKKNLSSFISSDLAMELSEPIHFIRPGRGGKLAVGYEATILVDICDMVLVARDADVLTDRQLVVAHQCEILTRAFAKVGIIALIDEVTGYQEVRDRDELNKILQAYISPELLPWTKRFPDEFYRQLFRLHRWQYSPLSIKRPQYVGKLTNELVYDKLPPGVLNELRCKNPRTPKGYRKYKFHQFLTEDIGHPHLGKQLASVITLMRVSPNWRRFYEMFKRAFPKSGDQLFLELTESDEDQ